MGNRRAAHNNNSYKLQRVCCVHFPCLPFQNSNKVKAKLLFGTSFLRSLCNAILILWFVFLRFQGFSNTCSCFLKSKYESMSICNTLFFIFIAQSLRVMESPRCRYYCHLINIISGRTLTTPMHRLITWIVQWNSLCLLFTAENFSCLLRHLSQKR